MDLTEIIRRRSDLSTFIIHMTRDHENVASENLKNIIMSGKIEARSIYGATKTFLEGKSVQIESQKCVCFTETPLEFTYLTVQELEGRAFQFKPYGIAITKKVARETGVNPVWYIDQTPGASHQWLLSKSIDRLVETSFDEVKNEFTDKNLERIFPFIEQMGTWPTTGKRKEFWWEREWRCIGDYQLPNKVIILCPEAQIPTFRFIANNMHHISEPKFVDPYWNLEQIIANLAGFAKEDIEI